MSTFEQLGLKPETLAILKQKGFEEPTPIQAKAIPALLKSDKDIVGQAQTGTGKTASFGLPILETLDAKANHVQALVLTPTRELAIQVAEEINSLSGKKASKVVPIYGGQSIELQFKLLKKNVSIVVGTPGRVLDHIKRRTLDIRNIEYFVLDEADEMLDMGFLDDVKEIIQNSNEHKRSLLFSATMPKEILKIIKTYMNDYEIINVTSEQLTTTQTNQIYFEVSRNNKFEALCRIIDIEEDFYGIVFCRTKVDVDSVANQLLQRGYDVDALHGDISQSLREKILKKFRNRQNTILIATDVAARGIDIQDLSHVINYSLPQDSKSYVHRIGRTGRAGKQGNAITFVTPSEYRKLQYIRKSTNTDIKKAHLPRVKDLIKIKKKRVLETLENITSSAPQEPYHGIAETLLKSHSPEHCLATLLEHCFQSELSTENYQDIDDGREVDLQGKTRLFVSHGTKDGLTKKKLMSLITSKCNISPEKIGGIEILERFSFVNLPFHEAEVLLAHFKQKGKGKGNKRNLKVQKSKKKRTKK